MFFPVSSTSHLALTQHWLISRGEELPPPESPEMILFDLVVHVGTLVSIAVVFRKSLLVIFAAFFVSAIVGIIALYLVLTLLYRAKFRFFSYYVWALAVFVAANAYLGLL